MKKIVSHLIKHNDYELDEIVDFSNGNGNGESSGLQFDKIDHDDNESTYSLFVDDQSSDIYQDRPWNEDDFNQELSW